MTIVIAIMIYLVLATAVMRSCKGNVVLVCGVVRTIVEVSMIACWSCDLLV